MHNWSAQGEQSLASGIYAVMAAASIVTAPVPFREKKDGFLRLCVDPWGLNAICIENAYPLLLMRMAKGRKFKKLDLREAYYQE